MTHRHPGLSLVQQHFHQLTWIRRCGPRRTRTGRLESHGLRVSVKKLVISHTRGLKQDHLGIKRNQQVKLITKGQNHWLSRQHVRSRQEMSEGTPGKQASKTIVINHLPSNDANDRNRQTRHMCLVLLYFQGPVTATLDSRLTKKQITYSI